MGRKPIHGRILQVRLTRVRWFGALLLLLVVPMVCSSEAPQGKEPRRRVILLLLDGLRPDQITAERMPRLTALARTAVQFSQHHSVFPTVTRVNASTISTGSFPDQHGILSNLLYMPSFSPGPLTTGEEKNLLLRASLHDDRILERPSLSEAMERQGLRFVAITSGSSGAATLLAPEARHGVGTLINAGLDSGKRVAYPDAADRVIRERFGVQAAHEGLSSVLWTQKVMRGYIVPDLDADLIIDWMTEPDTSQHRYGVGSPEALEAIRQVDAEVGSLLELLRSRGELASTDILITADHGFGDVAGAVELAPIYREAGLAEADVTELHDGPTSSFYLHPADPQRYAAELKGLTAALAHRPEVELLFTRSLPNRQCAADAVKGAEPGTFALERVHLCRADGPDLVVSMRPTGGRNRFGESGSVAVLHNSGDAAESAASHGGLNPWMTHIPLICTGPDFAQGAEIDLPTGNIDMTATLAGLLHVRMAPLQGRNLAADLSHPTQRGKPTTHRYQVDAYGMHRFLNATSWAGEEYPDGGEIAQ